MTEHPHQLYAVEFTEADRGRLVGFSCGDEVWSRLATEWILGSDVLDSMSKWGTRVWLFETVDGTIVGFGSLGTSKWKWPPPSGAQRLTITLIPMLGIDVRYRGQPADEAWRYSRQAMSHLISEAEHIANDWSGKPDERPRWLVLQVHKDNARAIGFYEHFGFELMSDVERAPGHFVMKLAIGE